MDKLYDAVERLDRIANRSKTYEFDGTVLVIRDYFSGEKTMIDVKALAGVLHDLLAEGEEEKVYEVLCGYDNDIE